MGGSVIHQLEVEDFKAWMDEGKPYCLVDVRLRQEFDLCHLKGAMNLPFQYLKADEIVFPRDKVLIVMCHHGVTSEHACHLLAKSGVKEIYNLVGGIHAWSEKIDQSVPAY